MTANVDQVAALLGRDITDPLETRRVEAWIKYADVLAHNTQPLLDQMLSDGHLDADTVNIVEAQAVARYAHNPEGHTSETWTVDDSTHTVGMTNADPDIRFTDAEKAMLMPSDMTVGGAFTISPYTTLENEYD